MSPSLLFEVAVSLTIQITLLVGLAMVVDRIGDSARRSNQIWTTTFVAILLLVCSAFVLPHMRWLNLPSIGESEGAATLLRFQILTAKVLGFTWLVGFVVTCLRRLHRCLTLLYFLNVRCRPVTERQFQALPDDVIIQAPKGIRWLVSDQTHGPFCWQLHRPTIVLPQSMLGVDARTQRHILRHEFEHLRTGHPLQHFLQGVCSMLLWFHPAMRLAACRAELTREFWCDEVAAESRDGVASYLRSLAIVSEQNVDAPPCTLAIGRRGNAIIRRSHRLVERSKCRKWTPGQEHRRWMHRFSVAFIVFAAIAVSQVWLPVNLLASERDRVSPWPSWTAGVLHDFGLSVRDYEAFDHRRDAHDLLYADD